MAEIDEQTTMAELTAPELTTVPELTTPELSTVVEPTKEETEQLIIKQYIEQKIKELKSNIEANNERLQKKDPFWVNKKEQIEHNLIKDKELLNSFVMILKYHNKTNKKSSYKKSDVKNETIKKYKKTPISLALKKLVWDEHIGLDIGRTKCVCCKTSEIIQISFHAGHIIAESKGGKTDVSNLKPICQNCNCSMGSINMDEFEKSFIGRKRRGWYFSQLFSRSIFCK